MESEPLSPEELTRRVRIIEGALGIELDSSSVCSGDPESCEADPCSPERCPVSNNAVQRMATEFGRVSQSFAILTQLVEVLKEEGLVTGEMLRKAELRVRLAEVRAELVESDEALLTVASGSIVGQTISSGTARLREREATLLKELREISC